MSMSKEMSTKAEQLEPWNAVVEGRKLDGKIHTDAVCAVTIGKNPTYHLVAKQRNRLYWDAGMIGSWMPWTKEVKIHKRYQMKVDQHGIAESDSVYLRFFHDFPRKPSKPIESAGWLAPDGKFYPCHYMEHDAIAEGLAAQTYNSLEGVRLLETKGWARVGEEGLIAQRHGDRDTEMKLQLTQAQLDTMFDLAMVKGAKWKETILNHIELEKELREP